MELPESLEGVRLLHLECGAGKLSLDLARRGAEVIGVDQSREDVLAARQRASDSSIAARFVISDVAPEMLSIVGAVGTVSDPCYR